MSWAYAEAVESHPALLPYKKQMQSLCAGPSFPRAEQLQDMLPENCRNAAGEPISFCPSDSLPDFTGDGAYEREIASTGRVSTRPGDLHDVCNAMVWARFPRLKAALNHRHLLALPNSRPGRRGPVRDALTLFDECGLVVASENLEPLLLIAQHDWEALFGSSGEAWPHELSLFMVGHANLERLVTPYPGMIAQCLLLHTPEGIPEIDRLDDSLARLWLDDSGPAKPRDLCPLPIMGIPGWWPGIQNEAFYANRDVFRPPREGRVIPPTWQLQA